MLGWLRSAVGLLVLIAVVDYLVLPRMAGTEQSLRLLRDVRPWWVAIGIALEALSLISYSMITRSVIRDDPPRFNWLLRSDLTGYGLGRVIPGGGATATALRYRLLVSGGARPADVTAAIAAQGIGCTVALAAIFWVTLVPAVFLYGPTAAYLTGWLIGALLAICGLVAIHERSRLAASAARTLQFVLRRFPRRWRPPIQAVATQLHELLRAREVRRSFAIWAVMNWLLDAAALWVFLTAFGFVMSPVALLLAYCIASLLAVLPITPGGLGVIEGVLIPTLIGFGVPGSIAVLGVVSWRLFQFWMPVPVAGLCYLSLRTPGWRERVAATPKRGGD
ncbi:YbhN family protein [Kribbella ginsengisoli]|uniref:Flippase-like domain-containing protein n=1 Tax=Kribbella ginsengisoli TaxID=363865 RepID=A0ABP6YXG2_9ACTN